MKFHKLMATALLFVALDSRASLIHQYNLNGSLTDAKGGASLVSLGGTLGANEYVFDANKGLRLDQNLGAVYSIDMQFRFNSFGNYNKIIDFRNLSNDYGFYTHAGGYTLYNYNTVGGVTKEFQNTRLTVTRDADKWFKVYQDGALVLNILDSSDFADFSRNIHNTAYFFRDDGGEARAGAVDFIKIYDHTLTAGEVNAPPPVALPEPGSFGLMAAGLALAGWTRRRKA
ncbi:PEP-CTERM sorting domain-containing protein [Massilia niastensis]|uniref:PEP-CTERM sorting domain-containing protein n=1 Tax=Massilia niastensis TaxID=544911 RepID=UPI00036AD103|nr:PEP-CTERM sorting domain-containing protein [Massilia niastensis]